MPKSELGKVIRHTLNMWPKLRRCFAYAEVELSNNLAEIRCARSFWAVRTDCTSAAPKPAQKVAASGQSSNSVDGPEFQLVNICWLSCHASTVASSRRPRTVPLTHRYAPVVRPHKMRNLRKTAIVELRTNWRPRRMDQMICVPSQPPSLAEALPRISQVSGARNYSQLFSGN